ncbi:MAG: Amuc_1099 family pilus-like system protein [Verrucomicrobiales bacterium]
MDWIRLHYDRALLLACGLLALLGSLFLIFRAATFSGGLAVESVTPGDRLEPFSDELVSAAIRGLAAVVPWERPKVGAHKTIPLFASTPFVVMNDKPQEPFDMMADNAPPLRTPIENWWLVENDLNYTNIDVKIDDPDRDGFMNIDEWEGKTDPNSSLGKPTFETKLYFAERLQEPLTLRLSSFDAGTAAIGFITKAANGQEQRRNEYIKVGASTKDGRFKLLDVKTETVERFGSPTTVPVAFLEDTLDRNRTPIRLEQGKMVEHPTFIAKIIYTLTNETFDLKEGDDFEVRKPVGKTLTLLEIHPDHVIIEHVPEGKPDSVKIKKELRPPPK